MLRAVIIDDEAHIRDTLGKLLKRYCPEIVVVGNAFGVQSGIEAIKNLNPELVFLDIYMGDGTGFDLLHVLAPISFRVIFVSAMDKNMVRAFKLSGMEYLLKPVNPDETKEAVKQVMKMEMKHFGLQLQALEEDME